MCSKPLKNHEATLFYLEYEDGSRWTACCAHCGVVFEYKMRNEGKTTLSNATTFDYRTGKKTDALQSYYLKESDEIPCCVPSIIAFETQEGAEEFRKTHGGRLYGFDELVALPIEQLMVPEKLKIMKEKGVL
jgi:nitrous oxide reductase accessory protein NosL